jgi:hypothetical protein
MNDEMPAFRSSLACPLALLAAVPEAAFPSAARRRRQAIDGSKTVGVA